MNAPVHSAHAAVTWRCCRFDALSLRELQFILMARQQVFGLEQNCVYQDIDGSDELSHHLAAWSPEERMPLAYARLVAPGVKFAEPSIGRVVTTALARGTGLGRELMRRAVTEIRSLYPGLGARISAQSHLQVFYASFGFVSVGDDYLEDGIPHREMLLAE